MADLLATPFGESDIDLSRPKLKNPDGSFSTERTATFGFTVDGVDKFFNIPTIVDGKQLTPDEAVNDFLAGVNKPVGVFKSQKDAVKAAEKRTKKIGEVREFE
jgi:hypothetical protein